MMKSFGAMKVVVLVFFIMGVIFTLVGGTVGISMLQPGGEPLLGLIFGGVFGGIGVGFLIAVAVMLLVSRRRKRRLEELRTYGTRAKGQVTAVQVDHMTRINGLHPLRVMVRCIHPHTGEELTILSPRVMETLWCPGDQVTVLFDPMNEKAFSVDWEEKMA